MKKIKNLEIPNFSRLVVPEGQSHVPVLKTEAEFMFSLLRKEKIKRTLEIGLAYGYSAAAIIAATKSEHYAIDPFQYKWYKNSAIKNLKRINLIKHLKLIKDPDYLAMPNLLRRGKAFSFIFIDGDHKFDSIFMDFYYADLLLNAGGYVLFHDAWMRSTQLVVSWVTKNKLNYCQIKCPERNMVVFKKKKGQSERLWYGFSEFFNLKAVWTYYYFRLFKKLPRYWIY